MKPTAILFAALLVACSASATLACTGASGSSCIIGDKINLVARIDQWTVSSLNTSNVNGSVPNSFFSSFTVPVDTLERLEMFNSSILFANASTVSATVTLQLATPSLLSPALSSPTRVYYQNGNLVGFLIAVINFSNGVATTISWADTCSSSTCQLDPTVSCIGSRTSSNCGGAADNCGSNCNTKMYVAYTGSDAGTSQMTSYDLVPTQFRSFSFGSTYSSYV